MVISLTDVIGPRSARMSSTFAPVPFVGISYEASIAVVAFLRICSLAIMNSKAMDVFLSMSAYTNISYEISGIRK